VGADRRAYGEQRTLLDELPARDVAWQGGFRRRIGRQAEVGHSVPIGCAGILRIRVGISTGVVNRERPLDEGEKQPDFASQPAAGPGRRRFIILTRSDASLPLHWDRATGMKTLHATDRPANYRTVWISDVHLGFSGCRRSSSSTPALDALRSALSCRDHPPERAPYRNSGDWVESCTALVELHGGTRELSHWSDACHTRGSRCRRPDPKV
jgi:hypothetical protein